MHGFAQGFTVAAVIVGVAAVLVAALMNTPRPAPGTVEAAPAFSG